MQDFIPDSGHSALTMTQRYIDSDAAAQRKIVELI
jgi:hypothetical protein